jgi:hypothetical protein
MRCRVPAMMTWVRYTASLGGEAGYAQPWKERHLADETELHHTDVASSTTDASAAHGNRRT